MVSHLNLSELNTLIKEALDIQMEPSYWVVAEIGEMRQNSSGHCYLELVEKEGNHISAKIRATIWCYTFRKLNGWFATLTGEELRAGMKILSQVEVKFHELYGLSLNIKDIDANFTLGERARHRQEVIAQLTEEGVMEMNKSLPLPLVPQRIAVISSPTAAGYGDFMDQLKNNRYGYAFQVQLFRAVMQGKEAEDSIIAAMHDIFYHMDLGDVSFDLLVIIRGGGAQVDLDCFDAYGLAAHVAQFPLPVITGIGHERDETVTDLVAHTKMKTPTAVAEFLINGMQIFEEQVNEYAQRITYFTEHVISEKRYQLESLQYNLKYAVATHVSQDKNRLVQLKEKLRHSVELKLDHQKDQLALLHKSLKKESAEQVTLAQNQLDTYQRYLHLLSPENVLKRGFTLTYVNGRLLTHGQMLQKGDQLTTISQQQVLKSILESSEPKDNA